MQSYLAGKCRTLLRITAYSFTLVVLAACATTTSRPAQFVGQVWDVKAAQFVSPATLIAQARAADIVLLGETHDNPDHHQLQQWMMQHIGTASALVMEQYDLDQQSAIDAIRQSVATPDAQLAQLGTLMDRGWDWPLYRPLVATALEQHLSLRAANISRLALRAVARDGLTALGAGESMRLGLDEGWLPAQQKLIEKHILAGHCGLLPSAAASGIAGAQRARDAEMADQLLIASERAKPAAPVIAVIGREHARLDVAVPRYLTIRAPRRQVVSIGLVEADPDTAPGQLAVGTLGALHDYLVLTPVRMRSADPCAGLVMPSAMQR